MGRELTMPAEDALLRFEQSTLAPQRGYMVVSDLCGSTAVLFRNARLGAALQAAHETVCAEISALATDSPRFKALGDGVMLEVADPVAACRIALDLLEEAKRLRNSAVEGRGNRAFADFHLKIVVAAGEFRRAQGSQRWLGLLPTKASRIAAFARPDEVWIDNEVASAIHGYLMSDLNAVYDSDPGAAFLVPLKGLDENRVTIHLLRRAGEPCPLTHDEQKKVWLLPWSETMVGLKQIVEDIRAAGFAPQGVVGIGRSGAILGGIIAGNLDQVAVDVLERRHLSKQDPRRAISTLTEPEEIYVGDRLEPAVTDPRPIWRGAQRVLLVIGEAKTELSFHSARAWLSRRGAGEVRTVALVKSKSAFADYWWVEAENAWLPWQFKPGYDLHWPTYRESTNMGRRLTTR
jgi:class 3 adenylate cyclase/hypoxanthine phosphoribosyltransferase